MTGKTKKYLIWTAIVVFSLVIIAVNSRKVYELRALYFSAETRAQSVTAIEMIRRHCGLAATDLELKKILFSKDNIFFRFFYRAHLSPAAEISSRLITVPVINGIVSNFNCYEE